MLQRMMAGMLSMLLLCSPTVSRAEAEQDERLTEVVEALADGKDLQGLYARFDSQAQAQLSLEALGGLWTQLTAVSGGFLGYDGETEKGEQGGYTVLRQRMDMQAADLICTVTLTEEGRIIGLGFAPAPPEEKPLAAEILEEDITQRMDMQAADLICTVTLTEEGRIIGLGFAPAPPEEKPLAAEILEEDITIGEAPWCLPGTLTLPRAQEGPVPAVVLVQGSGPSDRNETLGALTPFRDLAHALASQGIAVIRYDKRTFVYSAELSSASDLSTFTVEEEVIQDAIAAGRLLAQDERIDPSQIYLLGHSLGAMLAPRIADESQGLFAGMILACGTDESLLDIMLRQSTDAIAALPAGDVRKAQEQVLELAQEQANALENMTAEEAQRATILGQPAYYFWEMAQQPTASDTLKKLALPTLIINGSRDFQILPQEGQLAWETALDMNAPWLSCLWADVNHLLMQPDAPEGVRGTADEYVIPCTVSPVITEAIGTFVLNEKE